MKKLTLVFTALLFFTVFQAGAQNADYSKMSSMVRRIASAHNGKRLTSPVNEKRRQHVCALIRISDHADSIFAANGCHQLAKYGNIYIADIPVNKICALSTDKYVKRIEANRSKKTLMDSTALHIDALPAYTGMKLPQAFTGRGVVVGIEDIGFDLTHPNFYNSSTTEYRIKSFWDQLSADTTGSKLFVGNDYTTEASILQYAHSRDGLTQTHGTHTLGIASGSGYNSKYRGIAYESDICLVSNCVDEDTVFIDSTDYYKYTYATDALGFKYILDYADSVGKPCVVSFSEGSSQDLRGDDILYYALLDSMTGPGHIIVSSAGNDGNNKSYFHKDKGDESIGSFLMSWGKIYAFTLNTDSAVNLRFKFYDTNKTEDVMISTAQIVSSTDSEYVDTMTISGKRFIFNIKYFASCYDSLKTAYDVVIESEDMFGYAMPVSFEIIGKGAEADYFGSSGFLVTNALDPSLAAGECTHSVNSPSSAPSVISVGASSYRTGFTNYKGEYKSFDQGTNGKRANYSSVGPTYDGRIKPDVMAPGTNIISSYSSYYIENNPNAGDLNSDIEHFQYNGRTYAWNSNAGTSMSSPAVAGAIALWLQANPKLTPEDIKGIFSRTCSHYDTTLSYPNNYYGYGQIDVYRGLLDILGIDGVKGISTRQPKGINIRIMENGDTRLDFDEIPTEKFRIHVYSTSGCLTMSEKFRPGESSYTVHTSTLPHGIYAIQVNSSYISTTGSSLIRR